MSLSTTRDSIFNSGKIISFFEYGSRRCLYLKVYARTSKCRKTILSVYNRNKKKKKKHFAELRILRTLPVIIVLEYSVIETVERGIPWRCGEHLESAGYDLIRRRRLQIVSKNLPRQAVEAAVKVGVARILVAFNDIAENVETLRRVDADPLAGRVKNKSAINGSRDSRFNVF